MTPAEFAAIHAASFAHTRAWSAGEFDELLQSPHVFSVSRTDGFALGRVVADEAELLTLAVRPAAQGTGMGRALLRAYHLAAKNRGAKSLFLEVAADNAPALALYLSEGYAVSTRRIGYYSRDDETATDALIMVKPPE